MGHSWHLGRFFLVSLLLFSFSAFAEKRETKQQLRTILAQAVCLSEAYRGKPFGEDASQVEASYVESLGSEITPSKISELRKRAKDINPSQPTAVGSHNFAIAKCTLFSLSKETQKLLSK